MRVLGLDIGERRMGVALSDPQGTIATPHTVLSAADVIGRNTLADLVRDWEVGLVVVGIPLSLDGEEGPQAARIRQAVAKFEESLGVPVDFHDERLSSTEAERRMAEAGLSEKERRGKVDMVAASIILQSYLDSRSNDADERTGSSNDSASPRERSGDDVS